MRRLLIATAAALFCTSGFISAQSDGPAASVTSPRQDVSAHTWFVELDSPPAATGTAMPRLDAEEGRFHLAAYRAGIAYRESRHFRDLWNGLTVETDASGAGALRALPGVRAVYPVVAAQRTQVETVGLPHAELATALATTGVDRLHEDWGLTGRHVKVAVMDSGIDYDHPDFGGCFGKGCRVSAGWDFVGDAFNPDRASPTYNPTPVPDPLPDDCDGHGTHVAGIIGAKGALTGVAPGVELLAYRVFGCDGPTTTELMLAAMERAYKDGADVLNISIGAPYQWPDYPTAQASDRLVQLGMIVVSSAGNDGPNGLYAAAAPGIGRQTIGVASFDNSFSNVAAFRVSPDNRAIGYAVAAGSVIAPTRGAAGLARTGTVTAAADACATLPAGSLAGRIALVRRGTCSFGVKAVNAQAAGAIAVVMYNNAPGRITVDVRGSVPAVTVPVVSISGEDGALLDGRLATGAVTLTWTTDAVQEPLPGANLISAFSSYGPTADLAIKPDLGAPGGAIRSTLPLELGGYGTISGTSMSAPYISGAMALMLEARPTITPAAALARFQNTAVPHALSTAPDSGLLDLVHRQGAGMVDVAAAVLSDTTVTPARLALGDFATPDPLVFRLKVDVPRTSTRDRRWGWDGRDGRGDNADRDRERGRGKRRRHGHFVKPVTYTLGHQPAPSTGANTFAPTVIAAFATVEFDVPTVTGSSRFFVRITPPKDRTARLFGGYITLTPDDDGPVLRVPYLGYNGDYQEIQALTPTAADFPWLAKVNGANITRQRDGATYTLTGVDAPILLFHLEHQVRLLEAEILDIATGKSLGPATTQQFVGRNSTATSFFSFTWNGTYTPKPGAAAEPIPNGAYRLVLKILKARGSLKNAADVEQWTSPPIVIARPAP